MLNLNVPPAVRTHRYESCRKCKFYKSFTDSCGTLRLFNPLGQKLTPEEIKEIDEDNTIVYYRRKTRLCGCVCAAKTKLAFESCPIGKWPAYNLSEEQLEELKRFILEFPTKGEWRRPSIEQLYEWATVVSGVKQKPKFCSECVKTLLSEFKRQLNLIDIQDETEGR
jgi:hypothetical protein